MSVRQPPLQQRLSELSKRRGMEGHRGLIASIQRLLMASGGATGLRSLDLGSILSIPIDCGTSFSRGLDGASGTLVYAPVLWTWLGFGSAALKYGQLDRQTQESGSFLALWEQGFDGSLPWILRLHGVALVDVVLIGAILIIAAVSSWIHARHSKEESQLISELGALYVDLNYVLEAGARSNDFPRTAEDAAIAIRESVDALTRTLQDLDDSLGQLGTSTETMGGAALALDGAADHVSMAAVDLTRTVADLWEEMATHGVHLGTFASSIQGASDSLDGSSMQMATASSSWQRAAADAGLHFKDANANTNQLVNETRILVALLETEGKRSRKLLDSLHSGLASLATSLPDLATGSDSLAKATASLRAEDTAAQLARTIATVEVGLREIRTTLDGIRTSASVLTNDA